MGTLDDDLTQHYRMDRWHSGTTGKRRNCGIPKTVVRVSTSFSGST